MIEIATSSRFILSGQFENGTPRNDGLLGVKRPLALASLLAFETFSEMLISISKSEICIDTAIA